jgi:hypothetical protein
MKTNRPPQKLNLSISWSSAPPEARRRCRRVLLALFGHSWGACGPFCIFFLTSTKYCGIFLTNFVSRVIVSVRRRVEINIISSSESLQEGRPVNHTHGVTENDDDHRAKEQSTHRQHRQVQSCQVRCCFKIYHSVAEVEGPELYFERESSKWNKKSGGN